MKEFALPAGTRELANELYRRLARGLALGEWVTLEFRYRDGEVREWFHHERFVASALGHFDDKGVKMMVTEKISEALAAATELRADPALATRELSLTITKLEEALMWSERAQLATTESTTASR